MRGFSRFIRCGLIVALALPASIAVGDSSDYKSRPAPGRGEQKPSSEAEALFNRGTDGLRPAPPDSSPARPRCAFQIVLPTSSYRRRISHSSHATLLPCDNSITRPLHSDQWHGKALAEHPAIS